MVVYYNRIFCVSLEEIMPNVNTRNLTLRYSLNSTVIVSLGPDITLLAPYPTVRKQWHVHFQNTFRWQ